MKITTVGIDLAKNLFQVHAVDERGRAVLRKQLRRDQMAGSSRTCRQCLIGMEACASAHHWARTLQKFGHTVRLMAPQFVKPYVKTNKNDVADAEAICEGRGSTEHALRADQERRAAGGAVAASGTTGLRESSYGARQPDSWLAG
jgi:transposase